MVFWLLWLLLAADVAVSKLYPIEELPFMVSHHLHPKHSYFTKLNYQRHMLQETVFNHTNEDVSQSLNFLDFAPKHRYVTLGIGSPAQRVSLIIDTASAQTHIDCVNTNENMNVNENDTSHYFEIGDSASFEWVPCKNKNIQFCNICIDPNAMNMTEIGMTEEQCGYQASSDNIYFMAKDAFYSQLQPSENVIFGCFMVDMENENDDIIHNWNKKKYNRNVLGLNRHVTSYVNQIDKKNGQFAHYFRNGQTPTNQLKNSFFEANNNNNDEKMSNDGSYLVIGNEDVSSMIESFIFDIYTDTGNNEPNLTETVSNEIANNNSDILFKPSINDLNWTPFYSKLYDQHTSLFKSEDSDDASDNKDKKHNSKQVSDVPDFSIYEPQAPDRDLYEIVIDSLYINENIIFSNMPTIATIDTGVTTISLSYELQDYVLNSIFGQFAENASFDMIDDLYLQNHGELYVEISQMLIYYDNCIVSEFENILFADLAFKLFGDINNKEESSDDDSYYYDWIDFIIPSNNYIIHFPSKINQNQHYYCLDISFDWNNGLVLGSNALQNYIIIYNNDRKSLGMLPTTKDTKFGNFYWKYDYSNDDNNNMTQNTHGDGYASNAAQTDITNANKHDFMNATIRLFKYDIKLIYFVGFVSLIIVILCIMVSCLIMNLCFLKDTNNNNTNGKWACCCVNNKNNQQNGNNNNNGGNLGKHKRPVSARHYNNGNPLAIYEFDCLETNNSMNNHSSPEATCATSIGVTSSILTISKIKNVARLTKAKFHSKNRKSRVSSQSANNTNEMNNNNSNNNNNSYGDNASDATNKTNNGKRRSRSNSDDNKNGSKQHSADVTICTLDDEEIETLTKEGNNNKKKNSNYSDNNDKNGKKESNRSSRRSSLSDVFQGISNKISGHLNKNNKTNVGTSENTSNSDSNSDTESGSMIFHGSNNNNNNNNNENEQQREIMNQLNLLNDIENCQSDVDLSDCDNTEIFLENWHHFGSQIIKQLELDKEKMMFNTMNTQDKQLQQV